MATYIHEESNGRKTEYRRAARSGGGILHVEARVLQANGQPYPDGWYPVSDAGFLYLDTVGSDILDLLWREQDEEERERADDVYNSI